MRFTLAGSLLSPPPLHMRKSKPTVSICIPAHNEQGNIVSLLRTLLSQDRSNFHLIQIRVYCDGCTDDTARLARAVKSHLITVIDDGRRLGKNARLNQMFSQNQASILVVVDADIIFPHHFVLKNLVAPLLQTKNSGISCARLSPLSPKNLVQRVAHFGFLIWDTARSSLGQKAIRYYCEGALRAFSSDFATHMRLPTDTPLDEDSYTFYRAQLMGKTVVLAKNAPAHFKLPETLAEYAYQTKRYLAAPSLSRSAFPQKLLKQYEVLTSSDKLRALFTLSLKSPLLALLYLPLQTYLKLQMLFYTPPTIWETAVTTKRNLV